MRSLQAEWSGGGQWIGDHKRDFLTGTHLVGEKEITGQINYKWNNK